MDLGSWAEVQEQTHLKWRRSEIVEKLPLIVGIQEFGGFHLNDNAVINNQIHPIPRHDDTLVQHRDENFPSNGVPATTQLQNESTYVDILEKAKAQFVVHHEESVDDRLCDIRIKQFFPGRFPALSGRFVVNGS
jgi:hypothetical protein